MSTIFDKAPPVKESWRAGGRERERGEWIDRDREGLREGEKATTGDRRTETSFSYSNSM